METNNLLLLRYLGVLGVKNCDMDLEHTNTLE